MPDTISRRQLRGIMLPALREGVDDPAALLVLADALGEHEPTAADALRKHPDVWGMLCALPHGCWRCAEVLRHCRSLIRRYASQCYRLRRDGVTHPEVESRLSSDIGVVSDRESGHADGAEGGFDEIPPVDWGYNWRSMRHVRRLVDRALAGHDVPPDISSGILDLHEDIRAVVRKGGALPCLVSRRSATARP